MLQFLHLISRFYVAPNLAVESVMSVTKILAISSGWFTKERQLISKEKIYSLLHR